jgi:hypothetical protein
MSDYTKAALRTFYALLCIALGLAVFQAVTMFPLIGFVLGLFMCLGLLYWINLRDIRMESELQDLDKSLAERRAEYQDAQSR